VPLSLPAQFIIKCSTITYFTVYPTVCQIALFRLHPKKSPTVGFLKIKT